VHSSPSYRGGAFNQAWEKKSAAGEIVLTERGIQLTTDDGREVLLPYGQCQLEMGGNTGKVVFCRNANKSISIHCDHPEFAENLRIASSGLLQEAIAQMQSGAVKRKAFGCGSGAAAVVAIIVLLIGAYYGLLAGGKAAVRALPRSVDQKIGQASFESMSLEGPAVEDPIVVAAVQEMIDRLIAEVDAEGYDFNITVIDAPVENAFALPGGKMVVYTGLLRAAPGPEEVAGVLAHEIAHVTHRHGLERVSQSIGVAIALQLLLGDVNGVIRGGAQLLGSGAINSYSRRQELEADTEGVKTMHAAGLDPLALARFFETMKHDHGDTPGIAVWTSTHPQHQVRINAVAEQVKQMPPTQLRPLTSNWEEVRKRLGE